MMNKKIIIDLDGVIFEPIRESFSRVAWSEYGRVKAAAVIVAYKTGLGRHALRNEISNVLHKCAMAAKPRPGALEALDKIVKLPWVTVEFCSQLAFSENAAALEQHYRSIAPCMNVAHYELISPFESKQKYLYDTTGADKGVLNYVLDSRINNIQWPARWRTTPVLLHNAMRGACSGNKARSFPNLEMFKEFLLDQPYVR